MSALILPLVLIFVVVYAIGKRVNVYDCFLDGGRDALKLVKTIFPYVAAIFICITLFRESGLSARFASALAVPLGALGIPKEVVELLVISPLSGHGSLVIFQNILAEYGADSYAARCAAVISGATETIFYISAVYMSGVKVHSVRYAVPIALFASLVGAVTACALCRVM